MLKVTNEFILKPYVNSLGWREAGAMRSPRVRDVHSAAPTDRLARLRLRPQISQPCSSCLTILMNESLCVCDFKQESAGILRWTA